MWRPAVEAWVLINWLYTEIDERGEEKWPVLRELHGWRNIEVHEFITGVYSKDWTAVMFTEADCDVAAADKRGAGEWAAAHRIRWQARSWARKRG